jgi:hypothetical protein
LIDNEGHELVERPQIPSGTGGCRAGLGGDLREQRIGVETACGANLVKRAAAAAAEIKAVAIEDAGRARLGDSKFSQRGASVHLNLLGGSCRLRQPLSHRCCRSKTA